MGVLRWPLQVNLCRVFKLAKEVAESGKPLNYQIMPMMDAAGGGWWVVFFFFKLPGKQVAVNFHQLYP